MLPCDQIQVQSQQVNNNDTRANPLIITIITLFIDFEQVLAPWFHAPILPFVRASLTQSNKILFLPLFRSMIT